MSTPSKNKNLLVIIAVLLLTNIAVLAYFLKFDKKENREVPNDRNMVMEALQKQVGFNDDQINRYKQLKEKQRATIRPMFDRMRKVKDSLFRFISDPSTNDSVIVRAADIIAQQQKAVDLQTFSHFKTVREICTKAQQPKYDSLILQIVQKMGHQPRRTEPEKKEK